MNIVITGASKGIGKAIADVFASHGSNVFLCSRDAVPLQSLTENLNTRFPAIKATYRSCDVADRAQLQDFAEWVLDETGAQVDVLVNNAGVFIQGNVYDEGDHVLEELMRTNVYSAYTLSRRLIPSMIKRRSGHIFNISSIAALQAYPGGGSYGITKYAMTGLSANLREEMKPFGIKVTSVFPGAVYTDSWRGSGVDPQRIMEATDIAAMVYASSILSPQACVEEIVIRPQLGDL